MLFSAFIILFFASLHSTLLLRESIGQNLTFHSFLLLFCCCCAWTELKKGLFTFWVIYEILKHLQVTRFGLFYGLSPFYSSNIVKNHLMATIKCAYMVNILSVSHIEIFYCSLLLVLRYIVNCEGGNIISSCGKVSKSEKSFFYDSFRRNFHGNSMRLFCVFLFTVN